MKHNSSPVHIKIFIHMWRDGSHRVEVYRVGEVASERIRSEEKINWKCFPYAFLIKIFSFFEVSLRSWGAVNGWCKRQKLFIKLPPLWWFTYWGFWRFQAGAQFQKHLSADYKEQFPRKSPSSSWLAAVKSVSWRSRNFQTRFLSISTLSSFPMSKLLIQLSSPFPSPHPKANFFKFL